jgi:hypothetical protein
LHVGQTGSTASFPLDISAQAGPAALRRRKAALAASMVSNPSDHQLPIGGLQFDGAETPNAMRLT